MKKILLLVLISLSSCSSNPKENKIELIKTADFNKYNTDFIPYYFVNSEKDYIGFNSDFLKVKYKDSIHLNLLCYNNKDEIFLTLYSEEINISKTKLRVSSKNNGAFEDVKTYKHFIIMNGSIKNIDLQGLNFVKKINFKTKKDKVNLINNDTIKVQLKDKEYIFVSALKD